MPTRKVTIASVSEDLRNFQEQAKSILAGQNAVIAALQTEQRLAKEEIKILKEEVEKLKHQASIEVIQSRSGTPASVNVEKEKARWTEVIGKKAGQGATPGVKASVMLENRFKVLEQVEGESGKSEVLVIGDSQVSRLGPQISKQLAKKTNGKIKIPAKYLSFSGIKTDQLCEKVATELKKGKERMKLFVQVGTNDIQKEKSQVLLKKLKKLIRTAKASRSNVDNIDVTLLTIPSRIDKGEFVFSRSESVNNQLAGACVEEGANCLDTRKILKWVRFPLHRDGVHYSFQAAQVIGAELADKIIAFLG